MKTPAHRERGFATPQQFEALTLAVSATPPDRHCCETNLPHGYSG